MCKYGYRHIDILRDAIPFIVTNEFWFWHWRVQVFVKGGVMGKVWDWPCGGCDFTISGRQNSRQCFIAKFKFAVKRNLSQYFKEFSRNKKVFLITFKFIHLVRVTLKSVGYLAFFFLDCFSSPLAPSGVTPFIFLTLTSESLADFRQLPKHEWFYLDPLDAFRQPFCRHIKQKMNAYNSCVLMKYVWIQTRFKPKFQKC